MASLRDRVLQGSQQDKGAPLSDQIVHAALVGQYDAP